MTSVIVGTKDAAWQVVEFMATNGDEYAVILLTAFDLADAAARGAWRKDETSRKYWLARMDSITVEAYEYAAFTGGGL